jgi:hypothetical protein
MAFFRRLFGRDWDQHPLGPLPHLTKEEVAADLKAWSVVTLDNPESREAAVLRVRMEKPADPAVAAFAIAISIRWSYAAGESPFPSDEVKKDMDRFEEAIDRLTWKNGFAELVLVSTGRGEREWLFYARDHARFMKALNHLMADQPPFPIRIEHQEDPDWRAWRDVVEPLRARAARPDLS